METIKAQIKSVLNLSTEELKKVYNLNEKLKYEIANDYQESEMFYITDILNVLKDSLNDWSIGFGQYNYIKIKNRIDFLESLKEVQSQFEFLTLDDGIISIDKLIERIDYLENGTDDLTDDKVSIIDNNIDYYIQIYIDKTIRAFNEMTDYTDDDILDYFLDFYAEERLSKNCYINIETFELFENISYIKSYK